MADNVNTTTATYDFLLVGAGTAACLIASRLSQRLPKYQILVLEAGQHVLDDLNVRTPGLASTLQSHPAYDWQYVSAPEAGLNNRRVKHPRGKLVGGSSAINSHSVVFPNHEWQDRISTELLSGDGRAEWSSEGMSGCYERWQAPGSTPTLGGCEEPLNRVHTSFPRDLDPLQTQWMKAFEDLGHASNRTGFVRSHAGAVTVTNAVDSSKGERSHAGTAFLGPALKRGNVALITGAKVNQIVFHDRLAGDGMQVNQIVFHDRLAGDGMLEARGARYMQQGEEHFTTAKEVILCAGTFESPAILERSGIGREEILAAANIPVLYRLLGVGENLQDHINCGLSCEVEDNIPTRDEILRSPEVQQAALLEYERSRTGPLSEGAAYSFAFTPLQMLETASETQELVAMVKASVNEESSPGLQLQYTIIQKAIETPSEATATTFMLRSQRHRDWESLPKDTPPVVDGNYVTVVAMLAHPFSRGSCHISADPSHHPEIQFNYLSHPLDTEILARHMRFLERFLQQSSLSVATKPNGNRLPRSFPFPISSIAAAKKMLPLNAATNYHPSSTCSMMREDLGGVVDERLRVYGTKNVRVCDASVLPIIPRGNILTAVYAYAEKAVEILCKEQTND